MKDPGPRDPIDTGDTPHGQPVDATMSRATYMAWSSSHGVAKIVSPQS